VYESRILLADDNPDMIYIIKQIFSDAGYTFIEAHDGKETLEKIRKERPDLVLLDLKMPKKHGLDVLRDVSADETLKDIPVIVLTVIDDVHERIAALKNGASDFLLKPPVSEELRLRVNTQLRLRQATKALKEYSHKLEKVVERNTTDIRRYAVHLEEMVDEKVGVIKRQHEELLSNLRAASKIQRGFFPVRVPDIDGVVFTVRYVPYELIGGDFYDVFRIDDKTLGFIIADVSGHGVPSAMITVFLKQEISHFAERLDRSGGHTVVPPKEVLASINREFIQKGIGEGEYFVTMVYGTYSTDSRRLSCSLAGHHVPVIKSSGRNVKALDMTGFPIGWFAHPGDYEEKNVVLQKGDRVILYTDGLFDLVRCLEYSADGESLAGRMKEFFKSESYLADFDRAVQECRQKGTLHDDATLLVLHVR
jgi:sigma-B regulation protein RsbU (phosphoserine phosphatase)